MAGCRRAWAHQGIAVRVRVGGRGRVLVSGETRPGEGRGPHRAGEGGRAGGSNGNWTAAKNPGEVHDGRIYGQMTGLGGG